MTKGKPVKVTWNGIEYASLAECANALGITITTLSYRLDQGYTCDDDMQKHLIKTTWNGIEYPSQRACANALGISVMTLRERLDNGYTCDDDVKSKRRCQNCGKRIKRKRKKYCDDNCKKAAANRRYYKLNKGKSSSAY